MIVRTSLKIEMFFHLNQVNRWKIRKHLEHEIRSITSSLTKVAFSSLLVQALQVQNGPLGAVCRMVRVKMEGRGVRIP